MFTERERAIIEKPVSCYGVGVANYFLHQGCMMNVNRRLRSIYLSVCELKPSKLECNNYS